MVDFRMDRRLQGRIEPLDVVQEAFLEASKHRAEFFQNPSITFLLWMRGIVGNTLLELHRFHLGTRMRDAGREVSLYLLSAEVDIRKVQELLGHRHVTTIQIYDQGRIAAAEGASHDMPIRARPESLLTSYPTSHR
jgi:DNA-directed RNA polymerase specialized sigma24 family protein